jgi:outer membrane protein assembly factor BamA
MLPAVLLALLAAASPADFPTVSRVEIEGTRRTSPAFVRRAMEVAPGDRLDPASLPALEQRVLNRKIFRSVKITTAPDGEGVILRVAVREKLTLFPVPVAAASRGTYTGGVALVDASALGGGEQLVLGLLGSNRGASGFALFRDPGVADTRWLLGARLGAGDTRREHDPGQGLEYRYRERQVEAALTFGRPLGDRLAVLAGWSERRGESLTSAGYPAPPHGGAVRGPMLEVELDATDQRGWIAEGVAGRLEVKQGVRFARRDRRTSQTIATTTWARRVAGNQALSLSLRLDRVRGDPILDAVRLGGIPGSRGFRSAALWAEDGLGAALEYQVPVWTPSWGLLAAAGFCDAGRVRWRDEETRYVAPGLGVRLYLQNVAIPVLGFDLAWATGVRAPAVAVQVGFRR